MTRSGGTPTFSRRSRTPSARRDRGRPLTRERGGWIEIVAPVRRCATGGLVDFFALKRDDEKLHWIAAERRPHFTRRFPADSLPRSLIMS